MKKYIQPSLLFSFLLLTSLHLSGQQARKAPIYILNGEQIAYKNLHLNPQRIDSLWIKKENEQGYVYMRTKDRTFSYLTLEEVLTKHTKLPALTPNLLFRINGKMVEELEDIRIDDTFFIYTKTQRLEKVKYLSPEYQDLILVNIELEGKKRIRLGVERGSLKDFPPPSKKKQKPNDKAGN